MNMAVDKPGSQICAFEIDDFFGFSVFTDTGNAVLIEGDIALFDLAGESIYDACILQYQIGGPITPCHSYQIGQAHIMPPIAVSISAK